MIRTIGIYGVLLLSAGLAHAQAPLDLFDALMGAMNAPTGSYQTQIQGKMADYLRGALHANSALFVDVSTVSALPQEGCKRLRAKVTGPGLQAPNTQTGVLTPVTFTMEINLCADGRAPVIPAMTAATPANFGTTATPTRAPSP